MVNYNSSLFILFCTIEAGLITHTTDVHIWNNKSNMLFLNVLIQSRSVCHNPFGFIDCIASTSSPHHSCLHTLSLSWRQQGLFSLPSEEYICYHFFLNRMKNNFHRTRLNIYFSRHEAKVVFRECYQCCVMLWYFSSVNHLTPTGSNRTCCIVISSIFLSSQATFIGQVSS